MSSIKRGFQVNYFSISFVYSSSKRGQKFANVKKGCCMQSIQMTVIMGWGCNVAQILVLQFCKACNEGTGLWKPLRDYHDRTVSDHIVLFAFLIQLLKLIFGFYCIWFYFCKFLIPNSSKKEWLLFFNWRSRFFSAKFWYEIIWFFSYVLPFRGRRD